MMRAGEIRTDIVLLGGGHAHVHVLKAFAMKPEAGVRLTLVTRDLNTPYSGRLPGVIAGLYTEAEAHIDLLRLTAASGTRLIHAEAIGVDRAPNHALNGVFAMGGIPRHALATAVIPVGPPDKVEEAFFQLLSGASRWWAATRAKGWIFRWA